jgi:DNA-binding GntR family transcriptional regulator
LATAAAAGEVTRYYDLNDQFHRAIVIGAKNATLGQLHEKMMLHVHRARHRVKEYEPLSKSAAQRHDAIITHLLHGDEDAAGKAIRVHLEDVISAVLSKIRDHALPSAEKAG